MLVAAMNRCPCGYYGTNSGQECSCTAYQVNRYVSKISGPLMDRIDIVVETVAVEYKDLISDKKIESSNEMKLRVEKAREIQLERYKKTKYLFNAQLNGVAIKKYCSLTPASQKLMNLAFDRMKLSARGYSRILKVARTIADLEGNDSIAENHLAEALQYKNVNGLVP